MFCIEFLYLSFFFFFNDTATTEIYTLSLHDALPISAISQASGHHACSSRDWLPCACLGPKMGEAIGAFARPRGHRDSAFRAGGGRDAPRASAKAQSTGAPSTGALPGSGRLLGERRRRGGASLLPRLGQCRSGGRRGIPRTDEAGRPRLSPASVQDRGPRVSQGARAEPGVARGESKSGNRAGPQRSWAAGVSRGEQAAGGSAEVGRKQPQRLAGSRDGASIHQTKGKSGRGVQALPLPRANW